MILSAIFVFGLSLRPIVSRDALKLHMAFPDLWKSEGFLFFNKFNAGIELGMMNMDYFYMILLKFFGWEQLPKIFHASFLVLTAYILYFFIKKYYSKNYAVWAYFLILTIPINIRLSSEVYVDLGVLFFSTVCIVYYIKSFESEFNPNYLYISAIACGLAAGTKYNAFVLAFVMVLLVLKRISVNSDSRKAIKYALIYSGITALIISPWLIRNYIGSGNPFYPLFSGMFSSVFEYPESLLFDPSDAKEIFLRIQSGESFIQILLIPLRFFFSGKDHDFLRFDGVLNPFIIFLVPFAFFRAKDRICKSLKGDLLIIFIFILFFASYYDIQRIRYAIPALAPLMILSVSGFYNILSFIKKRSYRIIAITLISVPLFGHNFRYIKNFVTNTEMIPYITGNISKENYLSKNLKMYGIYKYLNENTPADAVIFDVMAGNRYYYVKRKYVCVDTNLNWWFLNITYQNGEPTDYYRLLSSLPNTEGLKADYLLIKPDIYSNIFMHIFFDTDDPSGRVNNKKLKGYLDFIQAQTPLIEEYGTVLYRINY